MYQLSCDWVESYFHIPCSSMVLEMASKGWDTLHSNNSLKLSGQNYRPEDKELLFVSFMKNSVVFSGFFLLTYPTKSKLGSTREGPYVFFSDFFVFLYLVGRVNSYTCCSVVTLQQNWQCCFQKHMSGPCPLSLHPAQ